MIQRKAGMRDRLHRAFFFLYLLNICGQKNHKFELITFFCSHPLNSCKRNARWPTSASLCRQVSVIQYLNTTSVYCKEVKFLLLQFWISLCDDYCNTCWQHYKYILLIITWKMFVPFGFSFRNFFSPWKECPERILCWCPFYHGHQHNIVFSDAWGRSNELLVF